MQKLAVVFSFFVALLTLPLPLSAATAPSADGKPAAIREMLKEMKVDNLSLLYGQSMTAQIFQAFKAADPNLPPEAPAIIREEVGKMLDRDGDLLLEQLVGIYDRAFTEAEVRELTSFYRSDIGRKTMTVLPQIMQESMALGKIWGQSIGPDLMARLEERFGQVRPEPAK